MNWIYTVTAILVLPVAAIAQSPGAVERPGNDLNIGHQQMELPADVLVDQLWIVDDDVVDYGNGAAISGISIFGVVYDLQLSDPFEVPVDTDITRVVTDFLNFNGGPYSPATDVLVEFFPDAGGGFASEVPAFQMTGTVHAESSIYVDWWGPCTRIEVTFSGEVNLSAGVWWVSLTPVDTTSGGDWYYACRSAASGLMDSNLRDGGDDHGDLYGGPYDGGYGTNDWITAGSFGYPGTTSFLVEGIGSTGYELVPFPFLELSGECPGQITVQVSNCTPNGSVAIVRGSGEGTTTIPDGMPCGGVVLDVKGASVVIVVTADDNGVVVVVGVVPLGACANIKVQAIDLETCNKSNGANIDHGPQKSDQCEIKIKCRLEGDTGNCAEDIIDLVKESNRLIFVSSCDEHSDCFGGPWKRQIKVHYKYPDGSTGVCMMDVELVTSDPDGRCVNPTGSPFQVQHGDANGECEDGWE